MFAVKLKPPITGSRIRLPRSCYERHDFAMIAPQYTNSTIGVNVAFSTSRQRLMLRAMFGFGELRT